jgi:hypothetical protein
MSDFLHLLVPVWQTVNEYFTPKKRTCPLSMSEPGLINGKSSIQVTDVLVSHGADPNLFL